MNWIITKDLICNGEYVGRESGISGDERKELFRLLDGDRIVYFEGSITADNEGFEPLDEFGSGFGCTIIQYRDERGHWKDL